MGFKGVNIIKACFRDVVLLLISSSQIYWTFLVMPSLVCVCVGGGGGGKRERGGGVRGAGLGGSS